MLDKGMLYGSKSITLLKKTYTFFETEPHFPQKQPHSRSRTKEKVNKNH